jgi:hypothetical protein
MERYLYSFASTRGGADGQRFFQSNPSAVDARFARFPKWQPPGRQWIPGFGPENCAACGSNTETLSTAVSLSSYHSYEAASNCLVHRRRRVKWAPRVLGMGVRAVPYQAPPGLLVYFSHRPHNSMPEPEEPLTAVSLPSYLCCETSPKPWACRKRRVNGAGPEGSLAWGI